VSIQHRNHPRVGSVDKFLSTAQRAEAASDDRRPFAWIRPPNLVGYYSSPEVIPLPKFLLLIDELLPPRHFKPAPHLLHVTLGADGV
jgi:hypothetical protein